jgi:hypothetical protein
MGKPAETDRPHLKSLSHSFTLDERANAMPCAVQHQILGQSRGICLLHGRSDKGCIGWWWRWGRTPPLSCQRPRRAYQKRTKYRQIYRYFRLLALSNLFVINSRWVDGDRVKMALYR